jgi:protein-S-isoprenylcysteine O-methyltransferase Ste14
MLGVYIIVALLIPALYITILLEERELIDRFGDDYVEYSKSVPRLIPKIKFK